MLTRTTKELESLARKVPEKHHNFIQDFCHCSNAVLISGIFILSVAMYEQKIIY